eukprot:TRINITY_DN561_c1_g2_i1.p1 TRINITY_DN561_c1_g2~~TRINITY_DN561_c1_g2_i1.p1  ORF type:complete len:501 (+),score=71.45 TRINITY_DN561_c1_g2_i1:104-1504(+)
MTALESVVSLFMLIETPLKCEFVPFYQEYIVPLQTFSALLFNILSGFFTDRTESYAHKVLIASAYAACTLDALLFFASHWSPWIVTALFVVRYGIIIQVSNSTGKIIKMRLDKMKIPEENQVHVFNNVIVTADFGGRLAIVLLGYGLGAILIRSEILDWKGAKMLLFSIVLAWDLAVLIVSISISASYYRKDIEIIQDNVDDADNPNETTSLVDSVQEQVPNEDEDWQNAGPVKYMVHSGKLFFKKRLLFLVNLEIVLFVTILGFINVIMRFDISNQGVDPVKDRSNFCGGMFTNFLELTAISDILRMGGAIIFQFVLTKMRPYHFYNAHFYVFCIIIAGSLAPSFVELPSIAGSVLVSILNVTTYLIANYLNVIANAICPPAIVGFMNAFQGGLNQLVALIPVGITFVTFDSWILTTALLAWTGILMVYNFIMVRYYKEKIVALDDPTKNTGTRGCLSRAVYGYS